MLQLIDKINPYAELLSFFCNLIISLIAIYALKQLNIMKADSLGVSDRAAKERAVEYAHEYLCNYVKLSSKEYHDAQQKGIPPYKGPVGDFTFNSISRSQLDNSLKRLKGIDWLESINKLETIASAFVTGVADEKTGFDIIGRTFCGAVRSRYDILTLITFETSTLPYFQNIVKLYQIWSPRIAKSELMASRAELDEIIATIPDRSIRPLKPNL